MAEQGCLLSSCSGKTRAGGSNPPLSAIPIFWFACKSMPEKANRVDYRKSMMGRNGKSHDLPIILSIGFSWITLDP